MIEYDVPTIRLTELTTCGGCAAKLGADALAEALSGLGIAESVVLSTAGTAWAPAVAFGILLLVLGVRPAGLFGR